MAKSDVDFREVFNSLDEDGSGTLSAGELKKALLDLEIPADACDEIMKEADKDNDSQITCAEFINALNRAGKSTSNQKLKQLYKKQQMKLTQVKGSSGALHTYSVEEVAAFSEHINHVLGKDADLAYMMPLDASMGSLDLFEKAGDGVLLAKFVNCIAADTIDLRVINYPKKKPLSTFQINENLNLAINSCKGIGVRVVAVGAGDIRESKKNPTLALGLLWQMVKMHLLSGINLKAHPELMRLLHDGETLEDLLALSPEQILLRWMNYHLAEGGHSKRVKNFSGDVKDSEAYTLVMNRISPNKCDTSALQIDSKQKGGKLKRAKKVLANAQKIESEDGSRFNPFVKAKDIAGGNQKLNLAFVADLFNHCPGLDPIEDQEAKDLIGLMGDDDGDMREERAFRLWANTLGIPGDFYIKNLFDSFSDGLSFLKVIDAVEPGIVKWRKVEKNPKMVFKKNSNNTYACVLGKGPPFKFSLPTTGGSDITNKNKKLVLGFVWQLFRYHSLKFIKDMGSNVTDKVILEWCNNKVEEQGGKAVSSFRDKTLKSGHWCINLVKAIDSEVVDPDLITPGNNEEDQLLNARYAISLARAQGCCIFCLPEDIQEVKSKLLLTFAAAVMKRVQTGK